MNRAEKHKEQGLNDLEHYMASCSELSQEKIKLQERIKELESLLDEIEAVSCGESQIESDGIYDDSDGLLWIYKRIQAQKEGE